MKRLETKLEKHACEHETPLNLYAIVEAVNASIEPGEEEVVPFIVNHILAAGKARFGNA